MFVAGDDVGAFEVRTQHLGLRGLARLLRLDLDDLDRAKAQRAASSGRAINVEFDEIDLGRARQPPDGQNGYLQEACVRCGASTDQIFSML